MTETGRRSFVQNLIEQASASGASIDGDAEFMALVELWIEDRIEMAKNAQANWRASRPTPRTTPIYTVNS